MGAGIPLRCPHGHYCVGRWGIPFRGGPSSGGEESSPWQEASYRRGPGQRTRPALPAPPFPFYPRPTSSESCPGYPNSSFQVRPSRGVRTSRGGAGTVCVTSVPYMGNLLLGPSPLHKPSPWSRHMVSPISLGRTLPLRDMKCWIQGPRRTGHDQDASSATSTRETSSPAGAGLALRPRGPGHRPGPQPALGVNPTSVACQLTWTHPPEPQYSFL